MVGGRIFGITGLKRWQRDCYNGVDLHPVIFNTLFGKVTILSPYLWLQGTSCKPLSDMEIRHNGRSEAVERGKRILNPIFKIV